jgi:hypothetical protein
MRPTAEIVAAAELLGDDILERRPADHREEQVVEGEEDQVAAGGRHDGRADRSADGAHHDRHGERQEEKRQEQVAGTNARPRPSSAVKRIAIQSRPVVSSLDGVPGNAKWKITNVAATKRSIAGSVSRARSSSSRSLRASAPTSRK